MLDFFITTIVATGLIITFWGYGSVIGRFQQVTRSDNTANITLGISFYLFIAIFFQLFSSFNNYLIFIFCFIGTTIFFLKNNIKKYLNIDTAVTLIFIFIIYSIYDKKTILNSHDDYQGYLVFVKQILDNGAIEKDPFSLRLTEQGFLAGNYINAIFALFVKPSYINTCVAIFTFIGIQTLYKYFTSFEDQESHKTKFLVWSIGWCIVIAFAPIVNISQVNIPILFILTLLTLLKKNCFTYVYLILALSLLLLKGIYLITAMVFLLIFLFDTYKKINYIQLILLIVFITFPWLIYNYEFAGTFLYPILGFGNVMPISLKFITFQDYLKNLNNIKLLLIITVIGIILVNTNKIINKKYKININSFFALSLIFVLAIMLTASGSIARYHYPLLAAMGFFLFYNIILCDKRINDIQLWKSKTIYVLLIVTFLIFTTLKFKLSTQEIIKKNNRDQISTHLYNQSLRITDLQLHIANTISKNEYILVRIDYPFLLNFKEKKFFIFDYPGSAGPGNNLEMQKDLITFEKYLIENQVSSILFSYKNFAYFDENNEALKSRRNYSNEWIKEQAVRVFKINDNLIKLIDRSTIIYNNGQDIFYRIKPNE